MTRNYCHVVLLVGFVTLTAVHHPAQLDTCFCCRKHASHSTLGSSQKHALRRQYNSVHRTLLFITFDLNFGALDIVIHLGIGCHLGLFTVSRREYDKVGPTFMAAEFFTPLPPPPHTQTQTKEQEAGLERPTPRWVGGNDAWRSWAAPCGSWGFCCLPRGRSDTTRSSKRCRK